MTVTVDENILSADAVEYGWIDFESEPEMSGDGSGDPEMHYITITHWGEEMALIAHHDHSGEYSIDSEVANKKREDAERIVKALTLLSATEKIMDA